MSVRQCFCMQPAVQKRVQKEGPNNGRLFYGCPKRKCTFFEWDNNQISQPLPVPERMTYEATAVQVASAPTLRVPEPIEKKPGITPEQYYALEARVLYLENAMAGIHTASKVLK